MPPPPRPVPPDRSIRAAVSGIIGTTGSRYANVFWLRAGGTGTPSDSDLAAVAQMIYDNYTAYFGPLCSGAVVVEGAQLIYYSQGLQIGNGHVQNHTCTRPGGSMTAQVACCISWLVQQRYRGGHPRTYLPAGVNTDAGSVNSWTPQFADLVRVAADNFHSQVNSYAAGQISSLHLGTVSFVLRNQWRDQPVFRDYTPAAATVDLRIDTQRRRLGPDR